MGPAARRRRGGRTALSPRARLSANRAGLMPRPQTATGAALPVSSPAEGKLEG